MSFVLFRRARSGRGAFSLRAGFTLIELLVVIAIIALLIGILLPALAKARVASRQAATLVRLRDLGIGVFAYQGDYKGKMPSLADPEEKAFLGLSLLGRHQDLPPSMFINPSTTDTPWTVSMPDGRPVLADLAGEPVEEGVKVSSAVLGELRFHCSFSYDNDTGARKAAGGPIVFMGDRADYPRGRTFSANWGTGTGAGMCLLWTDGHAAWAASRTMKAQGDPNIYHHNEFGGEGGDEVRDGVSVQQGMQDTHLRFFSEEEDDAMLSDAP